MPPEPATKPRPERRLGAKTAPNRALLLTAAEELFCNEGYASVTARRVAEHAGLKVQLVYYYFQNMDELILEVVQQHEQRRSHAFVRALASPEPLRALWDLARNHNSAIFTTEILALANHRESIGREIARIGATFRRLQTEALEELLTARGVDLKSYPASAIVVTINALCRAMAQDCALGTPEGYQDAVALVGQLLDMLERTPGPGAPALDQC